MKLSSYVLSTALMGALLVGCGQQEQESSAVQAETHTHADGTTHAAHDDAVASLSDGHSHGGEIVALGEQQVLGFIVKASREGAVAAGQEAVFLIETAPAAEAMRLWVGDEQATNSVRSRAEGGPTSFHAHTMVPVPLADDAKLWVEVQNANGERGSVAFGLSTTAAASHSHDGETHTHEGEAGEVHSHDDHSHDNGDHGHSH